MWATNQLRHYKAVFYAAFGFGPYECFFCREKTVPFRGGRDGGGLHVHHIDGDKNNNNPLNLAPAHNSCHRRWHVLVDGIRNRLMGNREFGRDEYRNVERAKITRHLTRIDTIKWAFSHTGR